MTKNTLMFISAAMDSLEIEYAFMEYKKSPVVYPYFVGEYTEEESVTEDGKQDSTFMLTGFHRGTWLELEDAKEKIEHLFGDGLSYIATNGSACVVCYGNALVVPTDDAELKRMQINLSVKEWKVN